MTALIDGPDRFIYPVEVTASTKTMDLREDTAGDGLGNELGADITLTEGFYWGHRDASMHGTLPGLFKALEDELNNVGANAYTIRAHTPSGSTVTNSGLRIVAANADPDPFQLDFSAGLPPQWLGFGAGTTTVNSSGGVIESPYSAVSYWQPWPIHSHKAATSKDWEEQRYLETSGPDPRFNFQIEYGDRLTWRTYKYPPMAAAHVREGKALSAPQAQMAGLPTGDVHNAFYRLWDVAAEKHKIIVVHNAGNQDLQVDSHDYEIGYLRKPEEREAFSTALEREEMSPELYVLSFDHVITESTMAVK